MATKTIDVSKEQVDLAEMLSLVKYGTEIILTQDNNPIARLSPIASTNPRIAGLNRGAVRMSEDFDAPLPDEFWTGA